MAKRSDSRLLSVRRHRSGQRPRSLRFEPLEARALLSVIPVTAAGSQPHHPYMHLQKADGTGTSPAGLVPNQVRGAYGLGTYTSGVLHNGISFGGISGDGSGQTIAIVDAYDDPTALTDVNAFSQFFGLPTFGGAGHPTFQKLNQNGQASPLPGTDPSGPGSSDWENEESLDIEWAHAMAPMANMILFEASNDLAGTNDLFTAVQAANATPGVVAVSMSWSNDEFPSETGMDSTYFTTPAGHYGGAPSVGGKDIPGGITYLAAAGDSGAYDPGTTAIAPQYPASSPNVVAVGGTYLTTAGNSYVSETSWGNGVDSGNLGGGGGGISDYEPQPSYQKGVTDTFSTGNRAYPDVSADADMDSGVAIYDSYDYGSSTPWCVMPTGGTSLATPLWAGIIAVADQGRAISALGSLNGKTQTLPLLYQIDAAAPSSFHNITTGNSIGPTSGSPSYYPGPGFNLATGLGSPAANLLVPRLVGIPTITSAATASSSPVTTGTTTLSVAAAAAAETSNLTYTWTATSLPTGAATPTFSINGSDAASDTLVTFSQAGAYTFSVKVADSLTGGSATSSVTVTVESTVTDVSPALGLTTGGARVTITGTNLTGATAVDFGSTPATIVSDTATQIVVTSPAEPGGTVDVTVVIAGGTSATSPADQFTYVTAPVVTGVSPTFGPTVGGATVTIAGTGLADATEVNFGGTPATIISDTATQIVVASPAEPAGTVDVTVVTPVQTSAPSTADKYAYRLMPVVTGVSPASGFVVGGATVTITGSDLAAATAVNFGGTPATIISDTATKIVATSPAEPGGTVDVTVVTPDGTSLTSPADQFTYIPPPAVTAVSPSSGSTTGGAMVTILGTGLGYATRVEFGNTVATLIIDTPTLIVATSPAGTAGTVDVKVVTSVGTSAASPADQFTYNPVATVAAWNSASDGLWNSPGNWDDTQGVGVPGFSGLTGDQATFNGAAGVNIDLGNSSPSIAGLTFGPSALNYAIQSSGSGILQLDNGAGNASIAVLAGSQTIAAPVPFSSNTSIDAAASATLTIAGSMAGGAGNSLTIGDAANTGTVVEAQTGSVSVAGTTEVPAGTLQVDGTWTTAGLNLTAPGGGQGSGQLAGSGTISLSSGGGLVYNSTAASKFAGNLTGGSSSGGLEVDGGSLTLSGSNGFAGGTSVNGGRLLVTTAGALPGGQSLTIGAGGIFIFDPSSGGASVAAASAAPATLTQGRMAVESLSGGSSQSPTVPSAALPPRQSSPGTAPGAPLPDRLAWPPMAENAVLRPAQTAQAGRMEHVPARGNATVAADLAWSRQASNSPDAADQTQKKARALLALDATFVQYGQ